MNELFASGRIVDLMIGIVILEWIAITVHRARTGKGVATLDLLGNLLAGVFLMLALRAALVGMAWPWIAAFLTAALPAHLYDVARRWKR